MNFALQVYENQDVVSNPKEYDWFDWLKIDQTEWSKHSISKHTKNILLYFLEFMTLETIENLNTSFSSGEGEAINAIATHPEMLPNLDPTVQKIIDDVDET